MVLWELLEHKQPFEDDNAVVAASKTINGQVNLYMRRDIGKGSMGILVTKL